MPRTAWLLTTFVYLTTLVRGLRYDPAVAQYNLNTNQSATDPGDYWGERDPAKAVYTPSPPNWRFPIYTLFLDRYVNGDPTNDNANGTVFEHDVYSNQLRHGGDLQGLIDSLDYIQGMGVKVRPYPFFQLTLTPVYTPPLVRPSTSQARPLSISHGAPTRTRRWT
jgi:alpha-1,3-glucan synthase